MCTFDSFYHNEIVCIQKICTKPKKIMRERSFDPKSGCDILQGPIKLRTI